MKTVLLASLVFLSAAVAHATTFTFAPNAGDLGDLDHHQATTWGINWSSIPPGHVITGATLTISKIWDWKVETDALFIRLLDDPRRNVTNYTDNTGDNVISDYFSGQGRHLITWSDPNGGNSALATNLVYNFTTADLQVLRNYIVDPTAANRAAFGFAFDPDCHYYNDGVSFAITTAPASVPESGLPVAWLGFSLLGVALLRRRGVWAN